MLEHNNYTKLIKVEDKILACVLIASGIRPVEGFQQLPLFVSTFLFPASKKVIRLCREYHGGCLLLEPKDFSPDKFYEELAELFFEESDRKYSIRHFAELL